MAVGAAAQTEANGAATSLRMSVTTYDSHFVIVRSVVGIAESVIETAA